ncbi:MAG: signal peptidase II [Ruminococcaceae bacterium]|nr:signal peptidase II [Oscillospiraceae bacterium]
MISYILAIISGFCLLGFDQYTKALVVSTFKPLETKNFINHVINFIYVQNDGGAWNILGGHTWLLITFTALIMVLCVIVLLKYGLKNKLFFWSIILVLFGGIGNMIDRIFRDGLVVDFLHFEFMPDFPVFNIADCGIVIGAGLLILYFIIDIVNDYKTKNITDKNDYEDGKS